MHSAAESGKSSANAASTTKRHDSWNEQRWQTAWRRGLSGVCSNLGCGCDHVEVPKDSPVLRGVNHCSCKFFAEQVLRQQIQDPAVSLTRLSDVKQEVCHVTVVHDVTLSLAAHAASFANGLLIAMLLEICH